MKSLAHVKFLQHRGTVMRTSNPFTASVGYLILGRTGIDTAKRHLYELCRFMRDLKFSHWWRFKSWLPGLWHRVLWCGRIPTFRRVMLPPCYLQMVVVGFSETVVSHNITRCHNTEHRARLEILKLLCRSDFLFKLHPCNKKSYTAVLATPIQTLG